MTPRPIGPDLEGLPGRDPLPTYERELRTAGVLDDDAVKSVAAEASERVEAAIAFAKRSPEPSPESALEHVFA